MIQHWDINPMSFDVRLCRNRVTRRSQWDIYVLRARLGKPQVLTEAVLVSFCFFYYIRFCISNCNFVHLQALAYVQQLAAQHRRRRGFEPAAQPALLQHRQSASAYDIAVIPMNYIIILNARSFGLSPTTNSGIEWSWIKLVGGRKKKAVDL